MEALRGAGVTTMAGLAQALTERGLPTLHGSPTWTHTTVTRLLARADANNLAQELR